MAERDRTGTNGELARTVAEVADALSEMDHLPALSMVLVDANGDLLAGAAYDGGELANLARWAEAFSVPVYLEARAANYATISTTVSLRHRTMQLSSTTTVAKAVELGARLGVDVMPGQSVEVSAGALLTALGVEQVTA